MYTSALTKRNEDLAAHTMNPKLLRFLAAPKPPGKTIAATSEEALRVVIGWTASLAILELSLMTDLSSFISEPLVWSTT